MIKYNNNISSNYHSLCFTEESRACLGQHEDDLMVTEFSFLGNLSFEFMSSKCLFIWHILPINHIFLRKFRRNCPFVSIHVQLTLLVLVWEQEMGAGIQAALFHLAVWRFWEASCNHRYICMCSLLPPGRHLFTCTCLLGSPHPCKQASPLSANQYLS